MKKIFIAMFMAFCSLGISAQTENGFREIEVQDSYLGQKLAFDDSLCSSEKMDLRSMSRIAWTSGSKVAAKTVTYAKRCSMATIGSSTISMWLRCSTITVAYSRLQPFRRLRASTKSNSLTMRVAYRSHALSRSKKSSRDCADLPRILKWSLFNKFNTAARPCGI